MTLFPIHEGIYLHVELKIGIAVVPKFCPNLRQQLKKKTYLSLK